MNSIKRLKGRVRIGTHYAVFSLLLALSLLTGVTTLVLASDVSDAIWHGDITITNNGTEASAVSTNMSLSSGALIEDGYALADLSDIAVQINGADTAFMPGVNATSPWIIFVNIIGAIRSVSYDLFSGNVTDGKLRYFPGSGGMTSPDSASLELSDNFTIKQKGRVDTANGSDKNLIYKEGAFRTFICENTSGNITSTILDFESPTGFTDPSANWNNEPSGYDENTATPANGTAGATSWSSYIHYDKGSITANGVRIWAGVDGTTAEEINIWINSGGWIDIYSGAFDDEAWVAYDFGDIYSISDVRIRLYNDTGGGKTTRVYEVDFLECQATATLNDISSGEYIVTTIGNPPFLGIGLDIGGATGFPSVTDNLVFNAPLWNVGLSASPFITEDTIGHSCTVTDALWTSSGYSFDGTDDNIDCGTDISLGATANGTVEFWISFSTAGTQEWFLEIRETTFTDYLSIDRAADNTLQFKIEDGNVLKTHLNTVETITDSGFHHIVATQNGTNASIYFDGTICSVTGTNSAYWTAHLDPLAKVLLGKAANWGELEGVIGEVRVYSRALTPAEILANYDATKWKFIGDHTDDDFEYVYSGVPVPDNSANWTYYQNMGGYWEYTETSVNGIQVQYIDWEYDTTFSDSSGYGNDATPTFRTTSSDNNVSASLRRFGPVEEAQLATFTITSEYAILTSNATLPTEMYSELDVTRIPGGEAVNIMLSEGGIPQAAWWFPFLYLGICIIGLTVYSATTLGRTGVGDRLREGQIDGSLFIMFVVMEVPIAILGIMDVTPYWPAILFPIPAIAIILSRKHYSWG